jgi:hypothetical protein
MEKDTSKKLSKAVRSAYSAAAERPQERHSFPVGRQFAESLGYTKELLDGVPSVAVDAFTCVSNMSVNNSPFQQRACHIEYFPYLCPKKPRYHMPISAQMAAVTTT